MPSKLLPDDPELISNCNTLLDLCFNIKAVRAELKSAMGPRHLELEKELGELNRRYGRVTGALQKSFEWWILKAVSDYKRIYKEFAPFLNQEDLLQEVRIRMWKTPPDAEPTTTPVARVRLWIKKVVINYLMDVLDMNAKMVVLDDEPKLEKINDSESFDTVRPEDKKRIRRELLVFTLSMQHLGNDAEEKWAHQIEEGEARLQDGQQENSLERGKNQVLDAFNYYMNEVWPTLMSPKCYEVIKLDYEFIQEGKTLFGAEIAEQLNISPDCLYKRRERGRAALMIWWLQFTNELK